MAQRVTTIQAASDRADGVQAAGVVGKLLAERALAQKVKAVHWERKQGQRYHGKIAAVIESMKAAGLPLN